jgi:hypothetical protein
MTILERLTAQQVDPDKLGKVIDLVREWNADQAKKAFARAMNYCQAEMPDVIHDSTNTHTGSTYAKLDTVQRVAKPVYTKHGFSLSWSEGPVVNGLREVLMTVRHVDGHTEVHHGHYPIDGEGAKGGKSMNALQGTVSAHTYACRDMMRQLFNIALANMDQDGNTFEELSPGQIEALNTLLERCHKECKDYNPQGFWSWIHAEDNTKKRMKELSATQYDEAVRGLTNKLKQGAKK